MRCKAVQYFDEDYLKKCKKIGTEQILSFLEDFRQLHGRTDFRVKSESTRIKTSENPLNDFKIKKSPAKHI